MKVDPAEVLGMKVVSAESADDDVPQLRVHFKKKETISPDTAKALGELVLAADRALQLQKKL